MKKIIGLIFLLTPLNILSQYSHTPFSDPPSWAKDIVWYQIFVERFYNGDPYNDPAPENINIPPLKKFTPLGWKVTPWGHDWYELEEWAENTGKTFYENLLYRRFGGDLQGVLEKLDYLEDLGVTGIYFNPLNDAPSLHKYDARYYHHIDVNFGPDPEADNRIIDSENPADPSTWRWTKADELFLKVISEVHKRGMKVIIDYSWNHTGVMFWAWQDILKNQSSSAYKDWFEIISFDNPITPQNEFKYKGWHSVESMPELKKVNVAGPRVNGNPYSGDLNPEAKEHIFAVAKRWLAPQGDTQKGVDGFRLDVADQVGLNFWRDFRKFVRSVKEDAFLVGEIWWEKWPDTFMNPVPYTKGDIFDAVMFYHVYRPARCFFADTELPINARQLRDSLQFQWNRLNQKNLYAMMNTSSSHDSPRLLSDFFNTGKYKFKVLPRDEPSYKTGRPDKKTYQRLYLYLIHLFTTIGAPHIWNGEEMGMWGADDPDCRKPLWWKEIRFDPETRYNYRDGENQYDSVEFNQEHFSFYKKLITVRKTNAVLNTGGLAFITADGKKLAYRRYDDKNELIVLFNLDDDRQTFNLKNVGPFKNLLNDEIIHGPSIKLNSMSALILKPLKPE
jgi:glycosidase